LINDANGSNSTLNFSNMALSGLTADGFVVDGGNAGAGDPKVNIDQSTFVNTGGSAVVVKDVYNEGRVRVTNSVIEGTTAAGVQVTNGQAYIANTKFERIGTAGVDATAGTAPGVFGNEATVQVVDSTFSLVPVGVRAQATENGVMNVTINGNRIVTTGGNGIIMSVADAPGAVVNASVVDNRVSGAATIVGMRPTASSSPVRASSTSGLPTRPTSRGSTTAPPSRICPRMSSMATATSSSHRRRSTIRPSSSRCRPTDRRPEDLTKLQGGRPVRSGRPPARFRPARRRRC
jgi:hypothetical protein